MNRLLSIGCVALGFVLAWPSNGAAQDDVTIPKSRLEELERKEKELERLQKQPSAPAPGAQAVAPNAPIPTNAIPQAVPAPLIINHTSPPMATLPPLAEGATVEAMDLANYYRQDPKAADIRFKNRKVILRGQIVGFEKPMMVRDYRVLLQSSDPKMRVVCELFPPERFTTVFTLNHGSELVGLQGETRVPLAKAGQTILVTGKCKGLSEDTIRFYAPGLFQITKEQAR